MALNINGTTGISGVDGSASAPALQGTDSNTGINFASDTVNINTGGVVRTTVDSSGNVTCANDLSVDNNLKIDSGFGSTTTVYGCRAWIRINQSGSQSITGSGGVSSISDGGTGTTTINFTTAMPDVNYSMVGGAQQHGNSSANYGFYLCMQVYNTTNAQIIYRPVATSDQKADQSNISLAFFR
tara:strand:- start:383 stop:934 length:552 start_codon:yes stop_codon:yes gene_type:complete